MTLIQEFDQLNYSQALESDAEAQAWLQSKGRRFGHYINGAFVSAADAQLIDVTNPATGKVLAQIEAATSAQVDQAIASAREAQPSWFSGGGLGRAKVLYALARNLQKYARLTAVLETLDNGKPIRESRDADIPLAIRHFYHHAGWAKLQHQELPNHGPVGVAAQIIPWNFPLLMLAWKVAPAIAMGNAIVIKPAQQTPLTAMLFAQICHESGVPAGVVNIICGYGHTTGAALVCHSGIDQIVFTGSVPTGQAILRAATEHVVPSVMELGGKSAGIVFADADLDQVLSSAEVGNLYNSGQVCSAMSRLIVHEDIKQELTQKLIARFGAKVIGAGIDESDVTPILTVNQLAKIDAMCEHAVNQGGQCLLGGKSLDRTGYFMPPTIIEAAHDSDIAQQEVFGPVLVLMSFTTEQQAYDLANGTEFGLVAGVFTQNINLALRASNALVAGQVFVNEWFAGGISTPFGGVGRSGFGREKGQEALYNYVRTKNIAIRLKS